jgi:beta-lactamase class A
MKQLIFCSFLAFSLTLTAQISKTGSVTGSQEVRSGGYTLINPLLDCAEIKSASLGQMKVLESLLRDYIKKSKADGNSELISVYFRDLNNGPWLGINEEENYSPASLLKVPIMISALYQQQIDPTFLSKMILYNKSTNSTQQLMEDPVHITLGSTYSIKQLIEYMIIHSDNEAKNLVFQNIPFSSYKEIYNELGIDLNKFAKKENFMTVREIASFYRVLYNSSFLSRQMSQYALSLLTRTTFTNALVAGVPKNIVVAHKFGIRSFGNSPLKQYHDCGIVYKPGKPYLLCVMTRGKDNKKLETVIADISKIVYNNL